MRSIAMRALISFTAALAFTASSPVFAECPPRLAQLLVVMGFDAEFEDRAHQLLEIVQQASPSMRDRQKYLDAATRAANKAFSSDGMYSEFCGQFEERVTASDIDAMMGFYGSPLARRMTELEKQAETDTGRAAMDEQEPQLTKLLHDDAERSKNFDRWNGLLHIDQLAVKTTLYLYKAVLLGVAAANGTLSAKAVELIDKQMTHQQATMGPGQLRVTRLAWAYTYRSIGNADFRGYLKFMEKPVHRKFYDAYVRAVSKTYVNSGLQYGQLLADELRASRL
jgi:hypothetical protein